MPLITADHVREYSTTTGTGPMTLLGPADTDSVTAGSVCVNGDTFYYAAKDVSAGQWETGLATWSTGGIIARTVHFSSNANAAVAWIAGTRIVSLGLTATSYKSVLDSLAGKINTSAKDASGGVPGLTLFALNLRNAANTITSWFTTVSTAARTWAMPDKDGTVALISDLANRVVTVTTTATLTVNADTTDVSILTAQVGALTIANPAGTPTFTQPLLIILKGDGGAISYGTLFVNRGATRPAAATAAKWIRIACEYNTSAVSWDIIGVSAEA